MFMKSFGIAVKGFIVDNDKLLVVKRSLNDNYKPGVWEIPGGKLNLYEDPKLGLKREIKEETGLDVEILHPLNVQHFEIENDKVITMIIFLCKPLSKNIVLSGEHSDHNWVKIKDSKLILTKFFHEEVDLYLKLKSIYSN